MVRAEQNNLYNTEQGVFLDSSTAYLDVVRDEAIVNLQKNNEKLLKKRLDETVERFNGCRVKEVDANRNVTLMCNRCDLSFVHNSNN